MRAWLQEDTHAISSTMGNTSKSRKINKEKIGFSLIGFHEHILLKPDQIQVGCSLKTGNIDRRLLQTSLAQIILARQDTTRPLSYE